MMKYLCLTVVAFFVSTLLLVAQSSDLTSVTSELQAAVGPVQAASKSYETKIDFMAPAGIKYSYDEIDQKGNKVNYVYEVNISDIDPYAVRELTQKDLISVVLAVKNKQKLIKVYKNNEVQAYEDQAQIFAKDIENARMISEIVKKGIPAAEKVMAGRLKLSGYDEMLDWLGANVKNVSLGTKSFTQAVTRGERPGSVRFSQIEADAKSSNEESFLFNLADINPNSIVFKISGNKFSINFETLQKAKYITVRKNGEPRPYVNEITINTNNVDEARDLKTVLSMIIPLAQEKVKADLPAINNEQDAINQMKKLTADITIGPKQINQVMGDNCLTTFTLTETDAKSTEKNAFKFNWMDVNPNASQIDVSGERLFIELKTEGGKKLIMTSKNDKFNGYDNSLKIFMPDIENARRAKFTLDKAVEKCKAAFKEPFSDDIGSTSSWLMTNIKEITLDELTVFQKLERVEDGNNNKLKFTRREINAKGSGGEEVFEFNLSDINPMSVAIEVKGKWLNVVMETNFKSKIIKAYKDGEIEPYANKIEFVINDVDAARNVVSALTKAIKAQK